MAKSVSLNVNGKSTKVTVDDPDMPLLYALRDNLGLHGPRFGCGLNQCGACTVHIDGKAVRSCSVPLSSVKASQKVVTLEGLAKGKKLHKVQQAFIDEQAAQCGYCINGMIMESAAFLAKTKNPSEADIRRALANNLCRCGTHARIVRAVKRAATAA
jgi:nicotinate dehydrogenase subunit A